MILSCFTLVMLAAPVSAIEPPPRTGPWRAWMESPGGELPFELEIKNEKEQWNASIINGAEHIEVPIVRWTGGEFVLDIDYYDSVIRAKSSAGGSRLDGEWSKRRGPDQWVRMPFHAVAGKLARFPIDEKAANPAATKRLAGRWSVRFAKDEEPAVGIFDPRSNGTVTGTFLTTTGDYRYLAGTLDGPRLRLSCFDGAHAFLFDASLASDGTLAGNFWSGDRYHDTWSAQPDADARLPDAFEMARVTGNAALSDLSFPDVEGRRVSLGDARFAGKPMIVEVFGTWCPNCADATEYLVELDKRYRSAGLAVVGLAFELTGDAKRDAEQVKKYAARHKVEFPLLVAGVSEKAAASAALPLLDRIRAYPTLLFVDPAGKVVAVYSGFSGPATGEANTELRARIEVLIETLLRSSPSNRR